MHELTETSMSTIRELSDDEVAAVSGGSAGHVFAFIGGAIGGGMLYDGVKWGWNSLGLSGNTMNSGLVDPNFGP